MKKLAILYFPLILYTILLIRILVFKNFIIHIGHLRFAFSEKAGVANFVPFRSIIAYMLDSHNSLISILNLVANVVVFLPVGIVASAIFQKLSWKRTFLLSVGPGLSIEAMQLAFRVGIFDVDDVMLNGLGVMLGYWFCRVASRRRPLAATP